jgi:hypothetical protein
VTRQWGFEKSVRSGVSDQGNDLPLEDGGAPELGWCVEIFLCGPISGKEWEKQWRWLRVWMDGRQWLEGSRLCRHVTAREDASDDFFTALEDRLLSY